MKEVIAILLLFLLFLSFGCTSKVREKAKKECISLCLMEKREGRDLSNGPCLSNHIEKDWVCDVAHFPREKIDNDPKYQCPAYLNGSAHHFVEVTPNCTFIRAI